MSVRIIVKALCLTSCLLSEKEIKWLIRRIAIHFGFFFFKLRQLSISNINSLSHSMPQVTDHFQQVVNDREPDFNAHQRIVVMIDGLINLSVV